MRWVLTLWVVLACRENIGRGKGGRVFGISVLFQRVAAFAVDLNHVTNWEFLFRQGERGEWGKGGGWKAPLIDLG